MFALGVVVGVCLGLLIARPAVSKAPTTINLPEDYTSGNIIIKDNAIQAPPRIEDAQSTNRPASGSHNAAATTSRGLSSGRHSTRAEGTVSEQALRTYLSDRKSPLAAYAQLLSESPYSSTIIGISAIEQRFCTIRPSTSPNNCWGIMGKAGLQKYADLGQGIAAIDALLAKYESRGKDTIEELNGYYVVPASNNWLSTVLKVKAELESL